MLLGSLERTRWLHLARLGSQSHRTIWFILPTRGASNIIILLLDIQMHNLFTSSLFFTGRTLWCACSCSRIYPETLAVWRQKRRYKKVSICFSSLLHIVCAISAKLCLLDNSTLLLLVFVFFRKLQPSSRERTKALTSAISEILWRAGDNKEATVAL